MIAWLALAIHLLVGAAIRRHRMPVSSLAALNLVTGACVLLYWGRRWFGYLFRGISWYATDQVIPAYALLVCLLAVLSLSGRYQGIGAQWLIFLLDTLVLLGAVLFFTFFRMNRLF